MALVAYFHKGMQILQLDTGAIREVYRDEGALVPGVLFFALGGAASGAGQLSLHGMLSGILLMTLLSFVIVGLLHLLARLFGGSSSFLELYRPLGTAASVHWVTAVPFVGAFLGFLAVVYSLVVTVRVVETTGGLPRSRALAVVALLSCLCLFLSMVLFAVVGPLILFQTLRS